MGGVLNDNALPKKLSVLSLLLVLLKKLSNSFLVWSLLLLKKLLLLENILFASSSKVGKVLFADLKGELTRLLGSIL